jgi:hypothetical protein
MKANPSNPAFVQQVAGLLALGNDWATILPENTAAPKGKLMAFGNDSQFEGTNINTALTEKVFGFRDKEDIAGILDRIAPPVPSPFKFNYMAYTEATQFADLSANDGDLKPRGGEFGLVKFTGTNTDARLYHKGLQIVIDDSEGGNNAAVQERYASWLKQIIMRAELIRSIAALDTAAGNAVATKTWSSGTTVTPDVDIATLADLSGTARGIDANRILIGSGDWLLRFGACQRNANPGVSGAALMSPAQMAALLGLDDIIVTKVRKQTAENTKAKVATGYVYAYYAEGTAVAEDASNLKRFVDMTGPQVIVERLGSRLATRIAVFHQSNILATNSVGVKRYAIN